MGNPVLIAPAYVGSEKLSDHFGSYVRTISPHLWKTVSRTYYKLHKTVPKLVTLS
jgi:hypothetical protein